MNEDRHEVIAQLHEAARDPYHEQKQKGRELVEAMFHQVAEREREHRDRESVAAEQVHGETPVQALPPHEPLAIHYTELPSARADSPLASEWNLYRREAGCLLAEGHENRWVLIKGEEIIGIWDTEEDARGAALQKYLMQPCLIHQVRSREPSVRLSARFWGCQS